MRAFPHALVAALLLALPLAGCLGGDEEPAPAEQASTDEDLPLANNSTIDDGTGIMDVDVGHQEHMHDYWKGRERATLLDADFVIDTDTALRYTFFDVFMSHQPGVGGTTIRFPDGQTVYEGTGKLEFTATWTDATMTGVGMRHRTPASSTWNPLQTITSGKAVTIDVTPEMTDMPHTKTSRWAFQLLPAGPGGSVMGTVHVKVDVLRMRDIEMFPGHPELFGGQSTLTLFDGAGSSSQQNLAMMFVNGVSGVDGAQDAIPSQKIVPMETLSMSANLTVTSVSASLGTVSNVSFFFKSADNSSFRRAHMVKADAEKGIYQFAWPVSMVQTDTPYGKESDWAFLVRVSTDPTGGAADTFLEQCQGCADAKVDFKLTVVAYDSLLPDAKLDSGRRGG